MKNRWKNALVLMWIIVVMAGLEAGSSAWGSGRDTIIGVERTAPEKVQLGDVFEYQIKIINLTEEELKDLMIVETVAESFKYESAEPAPESVSDGRMHWNLGTLGPRASRTIVVKGSATKEGVLENCNSLRVSYELHQCATTQVVRPALSLIKTGPEEVLRCDPIPIELIVTNTGSGVAENVVVRDMLPEGLVTQEGHREIKADIGSLGPGQSRQIKVVLMANRAGAYENRAVATADRNLTAAATHQVMVREPRLVLTKTGPQKRYLGLNATYTITVTNSGDGEAKNTQVVDSPAAGMTFLSASEGGTLNNGKIVWSLGALPPNASRQLSVKMQANQIGMMKNMVTANAYCAQADTEFITEVSGIPAILLEVIDVEDPIEIGANLTYVISVTNQGSAVGTNIKLVCTLPGEQEYILSTGPTKAAVDGKTVTFAPLVSLAPKAEAIYKVVVKGLKAGDVRFRVELNSDQMTTKVMETEATRIYE